MHGHVGSSGQAGRQGEPFWVMANGVGTSGDGGSDARGVWRTLAVLKALNEDNGATVSQIARATNISRPALYRILAALAAGGYVLRREGDNRYFLSRAVLNLASGYDPSHWHAEIARPIIGDLQAKIGWPTDFATFDFGDMQIAQTTRSQSPLVIDEGRIGRRVSIARTSLGRAYLAFCRPEIQCATLEQIVAYLEEGEARRLKDALTTIRDVGYATRFRTGDRNPNAVRTGSISVPVLLAEEPIAAVGFTFIAAALTLESALRLHLQDLFEARHAIEAAITDAHARSNRTIEHELLL